MRVLLVEDNAINRRILREMLAPSGVEIAEAEDGYDGLQMIEMCDYDLVLMDLRMPRMDGLTAIRHLRAREDAKATLPVIVITADAGSSIDADCRTAGANDVILKPVSMSALYEAIGRVIAGGDGAAVVLT